MTFADEARRLVGEMRDLMNGAIKTLRDGYESHQRALELLAVQVTMLTEAHNEMAAKVNALAATVADLERKAE